MHCIANLCDRHDAADHNPKLTPRLCRLNAALLERGGHNMEDINSDGKWIFISLSCLGILFISLVALLAVLIVVSGVILLKSLF